MASESGRAGLAAAALGAACAVLVVLPSAAQAAPPTTDPHAGTPAALKTFRSAAGPGAAVYAGDAMNSRSLSSAAASATVT
ncbi:hypothetical protein ABZ951_25380 [Streptomyces sp. NPDC046215]|uniref:Uncharacterized protein n=1 Tax=Streptomyces stramineus TaxID=173861 RepID=A0ABP3J6A8_9ACTN